ncbi:MAG: hypothetical protein NTV22_07390 [bacterium]|nr:hypothetical protein [bacterium]
MAASALGKLAWLGVDQAAAVAALAPVMRRDPHPQTRQYAVKALKAYGAAAWGCLHDLHDMARNTSLAEYLQRDAAAAAAFIEEAVRIATAAAVQHCQRCNVLVTADEYARAQQAFQRAFCDRCFDEVFLAYRYDAKFRIIGECQIQPDFYLPEVDVYIEY